MKTMGERITLTMSRAGLSPTETATLIGVTHSAISQWQSNTTKPTLPSLIKFVEATKGSLDYILRGVEDGRSIGPVEAKDYAPILSKVQAGLWGNVVVPFSVPADAQYVELHKSPVGTAIALQIDGYSMSPEFEPEDIIVIDTGIDPLPGDLVVALVEGDAEATFKRYRPRGRDADDHEIVELAPLNIDYPTLVLDARHPGRIIGVLMQHVRFPRRRASRT